LGHAALATTSAYLAIGVEEGAPDDLGG